MTNDPRSIADSLIEEHGLDGAIEVAPQRTATAGDSYAGDNYIGEHCGAGRDLGAPL